MYLEEQRLTNCVVLFLYPSRVQIIVLILFRILQAIFIRVHFSYLFLKNELVLDILFVYLRAKNGGKNHDFKDKRNGINSDNGNMIIVNKASPSMEDEDQF